MLVAMKTSILTAMLLWAAMPEHAQDHRQAIQVHGHRGARARMPENTIPAFEYAIGIGVDVLEMDLAVTKDGVLVVSHDPILHPPVCKGADASAVIHELTLKQVKEWDCGAVQNPRFHEQQTIPGTRIPTFDEVLDLAPKGSGTFEFNVETKSFPDHPEYSPAPAEFSRLLIEAVRRHKLEKRVMIQSFDFRTLVAARKIAPEIRLSALYEAGPKDFVTLSQEAANAEIVSPEHHLVTVEKVMAAHAKGIQVVPWTANAPEDWDRLIRAGVDAIISDDPAALMAHLKSQGLR
jgi:glycerophosphoryl diester phosphodiesterase